MSASRQLVAKMFTDIVGYTALMGENSAKALELVRTSKQLQKPLVEKHNGCRYAPAPRWNNFDSSDPVQEKWARSYMFLI